MKRIFRGPWLWIAIAVVGVLLVLQLIGSSGGAKPVTTSQMEGYISSGAVQKITFKGGDQQIEATLDNGTKVTAIWVDGTAAGLVDQVKKQVAKGTIESYNGDLAKPSIIGSLIFTLGPILLILFLVFFLMNNMQGGGGRVMQFAK
ncbi:MAG: ATP-dependent metallopeptidase FtsH/Yme1/Tma family protein, partial [Marmoricola sp.]